jgi:hypothetical protein
MVERWRGKHKRPCKLQRIRLLSNFVDVIDPIACYVSSDMSTNHNQPNTKKDVQHQRVLRIFVNRFSPRAILVKTDLKAMRFITMNAHFPQLVYVVVQFGDLSPRSHLLQQRNTFNHLFIE